MATDRMTPDELGAVGPFKGAAPRTLATIVDRSVVRRAARGTVLWTQGTASKGLYVLLAGQVRAVRNRDGRETVLHRSGSGTTLGEIPLFDGGAYPATLVADSDVRYLVVARSTLSAAMQEDAALSWGFLRALGARARELAARLEAQTADTVTTRLAGHLGRRVSLEGPESFGLGTTQAALARDLGTVREVLARRLGALVAEGTLRRVGRARYALRNAARLRALADGAPP